MSFTLKEVVPWGRSLGEYQSMFALDTCDFKKRILGCGDGPASFNARMTALGGHVISADPIYQFSRHEIEKRIEETYEKVMEQTRANQNEFVWKPPISTVEELGHVRLNAMKDFLSDYESGLKEGRYVEAGLPDLPFKKDEFDLALCSHFLFLYSEHVSKDSHLQSIRELCRVAREVRIFPLLELGAKKSRHLEPVLDSLQKENFEICIRKVPYEFQRGGNEMLTIKSPPAKQKNLPTDNPEAGLNLSIPRGFRDDAGKISSPRKGKCDPG